MFTDPHKNIEKFRLGNGNLVADFGSGSGSYTFAISEAVGEHGRVFSVDIQKDLLEKLKNEAKFRHLNNIEVIWADLEKSGSTRLRDSMLDAVVASNIFFQLSKKEIACLEIRRILKSGGRVFVIDWSDSFGKINQNKENVFFKSDAKELFLKNGFIEVEEIEVGDNHYGIVFRKKVI